MELTNRELSLCEFAEYLTLNPGKSNKIDITEQLKIAGLNDNAILDATLVVAYFNFVNRIIQGLGVNPEEGFGTTGYKY